MTSVLSWRGDVRTNGTSKIDECNQVVLKNDENNMTKSYASHVHIAVNETMSTDN